MGSAVAVSGQIRAGLGSRRRRGSSGLRTFRSSQLGLEIEFECPSEWGATSFARKLVRGLRLTDAPRDSRGVSRLKVVESEGLPPQAVMWAGSPPPKQRKKVERAGEDEFGPEAAL